MEQVKNIIVGIILSVLAFLKPIEGELVTLFLVFILNFVFGYLSDMIANGADFSLKKALVCIGHATCFFILCMAVYAVGWFKHQPHGAIQCVSLITYIVMYFYGRNILRNLKLMFKEGTPPYRVVDALDYLLGVKFVEKIPWLSNYLNKQDKETIGETDGHSSKEGGEV